MKLLRLILLALLASLLVGFLIGTLIRIRLERPAIYFVRCDDCSHERAEQYQRAAPYDPLVGTWG